MEAARARNDAADDAGVAPRTGAFRGGDRVGVLPPLPLGGAYDYVVPTGLELAEGDFVTVPLGSRNANGVVWGPGDGRVEAGKLRQVTGRHDLPPLSADVRAFVEWVAAYTLTPAGAVLRMVMSARSLFEPTARRPAAGRVAYRLAGSPPARMTKARRRVVDLLADGPPRTLSDICEAAAVGASVVRGLADHATLERIVPPEDGGFETPDVARPGVRLTSGQADAVAVLNARIAEDGFNVTVIDGVPGSGKTEVYLEGIASTLRRGRQALVLLPEIALTARWLERFEARFGARPALWHSDLNQSERRRAWRAVASGAARVVVGARSALFLPYPELGFVVVDEEHDPSYKQEDGAVYNARDMAVARGHLSGFPVALVSATPSLETVVNVDNGRYGRVHLPERHGAAGPPRIEAIDMRDTGLPAGSWLSPPLVAAVRETLAAGEQAMLFLNRRGYAPLTLCRGCGFRFECPNCSAWLVEHRRAGRLMCHHCGLSQDFPESCPDCGAGDRFAACGPGVERLAEEVRGRFPDARLEIVASDTLSGPRATRALLTRIEGREIDILIGTQVLAKGHHFPLLTLVGVVDADLGLDGGDLRAAERTYQLHFQVAGRAGRADRPGRVLMQSHLPDHPVMAALVSGDRDSFLDREKEARRRAGMPPFGRLASLIVSGRDENAAFAVARRLGDAAPRGEGISVLGPAPAPLSVLRGMYRFRLLLKAARNVPVQEHVRGWLRGVSRPSNVRVRVDIDPYSFL